MECWKRARFFLRCHDDKNNDDINYIMFRYKCLLLSLLDIQHD